MKHLRIDSVWLEREVAEIERDREQAIRRSSAAALSLQDVVATILESRPVGDERIIAGVGGFPGSGKTTAAKAIVEAINDHERAVLAAHLPMDGFHMSNAELTERGLDHIKGDTSTYDVAGYAAILMRLKECRDAPVLAPDYVRQIHEVVADRIEIGPTIRVVVTEGIYVGYRTGPWEKAADLIDPLFYLDTPPWRCVDRIIERNRVAGRSDALIAHKLRNDLGFMRKSVRILEQAQFLIRIASE